MMIRGHRAASTSLIFLIAITLLALATPYLSLQDPSLSSLPHQLMAPDGDHWFGTDALGRDVFSRTLYGIRSSIFIALLAATVSLIIGVLVGAVSGFSGRFTDAFLMRMVDVLYGIPFICLVIFLLAILRDHEPALRAHGITRATILYLVVGGTTWLTMARLVRNEVMRLRAQPFVEAARALGLPRRRILMRHIIPNTLGVVVVSLTLTIPSIVLYEAFLSFLGLGIEPPSVSLGLLSAEGIESISPVHAAWWLVVFPGGALVVLLLAVSLLGDGLRDRLDPQTRQGVR